MAKTPSTKVVTKKHIARMEREKKQNQLIVIASAVVVLFVILLIGFGYLNENVLKYNQPVAKVGDETITLKDFQTQVKWYRYQLISQYSQYYQLQQMFGSDSSYSSYFQSSLDQITSQLNDSETLGGDVLDSMIQAKLIRQEAANRGITVSTEEVDQAMQAYFSYYPNGTATPEIVPTMMATSTLSALQMTLVPPTSTPTITPTALPTETSTPGAAETATAAPTEAVEATATDVAGTPTTVPTATPYTEDLYQENIQNFLTETNNYSVNMDEAYLRSLLENNLYYEKVKEAITADMVPEEEEVWARHILVADEDTANEVLAKLNDGADFAELAAEYSTDTSNKDSGGDLGWFTRDQMVTEFSDAAFALGVGEISDPVTTSYGVHIIQVLGHENRPVDSSTFYDLKDSKMSEWLTEEEAKDTVVKYDTWQTEVPTVPEMPDMAS